MDLKQITDEFKKTLMDFFLKAEFQIKRICNLDFR